jgi:hypothetical protein
LNLVRIVEYNSFRGMKKGGIILEINQIIKEFMNKLVDMMIESITELNLKYDILLSVCPVSVEKFLTVTTPFFINVRKEGVFA